MFIYSDDDRVFGLEVEKEQASTHSAFKHTILGGVYWNRDVQELNMGTMLRLKPQISVICLTEIQITDSEMLWC